MHKKSLQCLAAHTAHFSSSSTILAASQPTHLGCDVHAIFERAHLLHCGLQGGQVKPFQQRVQLHILCTSHGHRVRGECKAGAHQMCGPSNNKCGCTSSAHHRGTELRGDCKAGAHQSSVLEQQGQGASWRHITVTLKHPVGLSLMPPYPLSNTLPLPLKCCSTHPLRSITHPQMAATHPSSLPRQPPPALAGQPGALPSAQGPMRDFPPCASSSAPQGQTVEPQAGAPGLPHSIGFQPHPVHESEHVGEWKIEKLGH